MEALILGDTDDPDAAVAALDREIAALAGAEIPPPSKGDAPRGDPQESDEEVALKLARVFEDETRPSGVSAAGGDVKDADVQEDTPSAHEEPQAETKPEVPGEADAHKQDKDATKKEPPYESIPLNIPTSEEDFLKGFMEEAYEHIEAIEAALLGVERMPDDAEQIDALFRPFHTIKGAAGFLNLRDIVSLTHEVETLLDQSRKGQRPITPGLIDLVFDVVDILKAQFAAIGTYLANPTGEEVPQPPIETMIAGLRDVVAGRVEPIGSQPESGSQDNKVGENLVEQGAVAQEVVQFALSEQQRTPGKKTGQMLIEMDVTTPKQVSQALRPQANKQSAAPVSGTAAGGDETGLRSDHLVRRSDSPRGKTRSFAIRANARRARKLSGSASIPRAVRGDDGRIARSSPSLASGQSVGRIRSSVPHF